MGLIFSSITTFFSFWIPTTTNVQYESIFRRKIAREDLILTIDNPFDEFNLGEFTKLPKEMMSHILFYTDVGDILRLSTASKAMYKSISSMETVWLSVIQNLNLSPYQIHLIRSCNDLPLKAQSLEQFHALRILRPTTEDHQHILKAAVFGSLKVGKTQLVNRLMGLPFDPAHNPTSQTIEAWTKFKCHDKSVAKIVFYDTSPLLDGVDLMTMIRKSHLILLLFDVTQKRTFLKCQVYFEMLERSLSYCHLILIGTHPEQNEGAREVFLEEAKEMAEERAAKYFEISLKTGENLPEFLDYFVFHARKFSDFLRRGPVNIRG